jgi:hypothetical protein
MGEMLLSESTQMAFLITLSAPVITNFTKNSSLLLSIKEVKFDLSNTMDIKKRKKYYQC